MPKHRFLITEDLTKENLVISNSTGLVDQWRKVLRLSPGMIISVFDGEGREVSAEIISLGREAELKLFDLQEKSDMFPAEVTLCMAILKKENFDLVVQKAVEIGVKKIIPVITDRTVKIGLRYDRLQKIIKEATEQSGRNQLTELVEAQNLIDLLPKIKKENDAVFVCDQVGKVNNSSLSEKTVAVLVGPEGGWSEKELGIFDDFDIPTVSLGPTTLRAETAGIISAYLFTNGLLV